MNQHIVTRKAMRPASTAERCFYCQQPVGGCHDDDCVLVKKTVRVRMIVEYDVVVPSQWDKSAVEFHRNDGSWCADNAIRELEELAEKEGCLCHSTRYEYIGDTSGAYLAED